MIKWNKGYTNDQIKTHLISDLRAIQDLNDSLLFNNDKQYDKQYDKLRDDKLTMIFSLLDVSDDMGFIQNQSLPILFK